MSCRWLAVATFIAAAAFIFSPILPVSGKLYPIEYRVPLAGNIPPPGDVWPKPQLHRSTPAQLTLDRHRFRFTTNLEGCVVLQNAFRRYTELIFLDSHRFRPSPSKTVLEEVHLEITGNGQSSGSTVNCGYPQQGEDEAYSLQVPIVEQSHRAWLQAATVWGGLRALETFSQLVHEGDGGSSSHHLLINQTTVQDFPRFKYRGVLLDTARHYLPKKVLLANLDAMSFNKMNVFHWHLVDDQSFPFVSTRFPTIHAAGAYTRRHVYTPADVQEVIEYARMRGIRVIPELDTPGHTHAMARAFPELLTPCYKNGVPYQPDFPHNSEMEILNPMRPQTFTFMRELFAEFKGTFRDAFIHLGMDEVFYSCWRSSPEIARFMVAHNMSDYSQVEEFYVRRTLAEVKSLGYKVIIWQDPVDNGVPLSPDSVVAVWKDKNLDHSMEHWQSYVSQLAKKKYQMILSACWYLNFITYPYPGLDWEKFYLCDPRSFNGTEAERALVIGGQANIWGEFVDATNVLSRLWPRASAVAERLWSDSLQTRDVDTARHRLDQQRCRMLRRGIPAAPILNGYCGEWEVENGEANFVGAAGQQERLDFAGTRVKL